MDVLEPQLTTDANAGDQDNAAGNEAYCMVAFSKMNVFRKRGQLCDVVIKVGGQEFLAHRVVLAATSDYFDAMFSNGMAESAQLAVELKSISPDIMDALLDYVYTGQVHVTMENVQDLLPAASLVQMEGVKMACSNFLLAEVDASNVLGIRRFAELHSCADLEKFAKNYAAHNFEVVVEYEEFLCLNHEELLDLISREDLHIDCEESVYKAVMRWVYHQIPERSPHLPALLVNIRLPVMSVRFLTDVVDKDLLIRQSLECRDLVDDAKRYHLRPDLRHEMRERRYRQRDSGDEYLVVIGGFGSDQNPSDSVEMFDPRTLEWSELPDLPISYRYVAACSLDTCVYVIGGFDGRERLNTVCFLDIAQRDEGWRWLAPMHFKRGLSAACTHRGLIYVCGGFDGQSRLRSLEVYHPKIDEWRILENMTTAREGAGLVVVDDTLYCLGGYDGFHLLNSMEAFDLTRGTWSICKPMYMRRSGAGCALLGDTVYVCGGYGGAEGRGPLHLDSVEAYNTRLQQWTLVTSMNVPRCYVGACQLAGKVYVAAGYNGSRLLDTVESYDPVENVWLHEDSLMNHERCDTGMCVVRLLSCTDPPVSIRDDTTRTITSVPIDRSFAVPTSQGSSCTPPPSSLATGQAMSIRPPLESTNSRNVIVPFAPHLRGGLSGFLRPGLPIHRSVPCYPHGRQLQSTMTNSRIGVPSSTALSVGSASSHLGHSRSIPTPSLSRYPHLSNHYHQSSHSRLQAPGFSAVTRDFPATRSSQSHYPWSTRQLLSVSGVGQSSLNRLASPFALSGSCGVPIALGSDDSSRLTDFDLAIFPNITTVNPVVSSEPFVVVTGSHGNPCGVVVSRHCELEQIELAVPLSPNLDSNQDDCQDQPPSSDAALQHILDASRRLLTDSAHHTTQAMSDAPSSRESTSSSPTLLSRPYHSAPVSDQSQSHDVNLFRSVEQLNFVSSDYRSWLDRDFSGLVVNGPSVESNVESCYSRADAGLSDLQTQLPVRDVGNALFPTSLVGSPGVTMLGYVSQNDNLVDEEDADALSEDSVDQDDAIDPSFNGFATTISEDTLSDRMPTSDGNALATHLGTASYPTSQLRVADDVPICLSPVPQNSDVLDTSTRLPGGFGDCMWTRSVQTYLSCGNNKICGLTQHWPRLCETVGRRALPPTHLHGLRRQQISEHLRLPDVTSQDAVGRDDRGQGLVCTTFNIPDSNSLNSSVTFNLDVAVASTSVVRENSVSAFSEPSNSDHVSASTLSDASSVPAIPEVTTTHEIQASSDSRSDGEGEEEEEIALTGPRNPAVGQLDNEI